MKAIKFDKTFFVLAAILLAVGIVGFFSAALGLLSEDPELFYALALKRLIFTAIGIAAFFIGFIIPYRFWQRAGFYFFIGSLVITAFVFVPGIGLEHGGAARWIDIGFLSFQPAETLKFSFVVYFAALLTAFRKRSHTIAYGLLPSILVLGCAGAALLAQPDLGTLVIITAAAFGMLIISGTSGRNVMLLLALALLIGGAFIAANPYAADRILTFLEPSRDPLGSGYQLQQSLIAVGSGGFAGRGFGQSIQKFEYLPEAISDSIFAVWAEEFGFVGASALVILFLLLALRGIRIAQRAPDMFSGLVVTGLVILIISQSFLNIGSMIQLFPLTGVPLIFVSHGGTALVLALFEVGIVLGISRHMRLR